MCLAWVLHHGNFPLSLPFQNRFQNWLLLLSRVFSLMGTLVWNLMRPLECFSMLYNPAVRYCQPLGCVRTLLWFWLPCGSLKLCNCLPSFTNTMKDLDYITFLTNDDQCLVGVYGPASVSLTIITSENMMQCTLLVYTPGLSSVGGLELLPWKSYYQPVLKLQSGNSICRLRALHSFSELSFFLQLYSI